MKLPLIVVALSLFLGPVAGCDGGEKKSIADQIGPATKDTKDIKTAPPVSEEELARRRAEWKAPEPRFERGYSWIFTKHIQQANEGCDFDFLRTEFGAPVSEPVIYWQSQKGESEPWPCPTRRARS